MGIFENLGSKPIFRLSFLNLFHFFSSLFSLSPLFSSLSSSLHLLSFPYFSLSPLVSLFLSFLSKQCLVCCSNLLSLFQASASKSQKYLHHTFPKIPISMWKEICLNSQKYPFLHKGYTGYPLVHAPQHEPFQKCLLVKFTNSQKSPNVQNWVFLGTDKSDIKLSHGITHIYRARQAGRPWNKTFQKLCVRKFCQAGRGRQIDRQVDRQAGRQTGVSTCLPVYPTACMSTCLSTWLPTYLTACLPACMSIYTVNQPFQKREFFSQNSPKSGCFFLKIK